MQEMRGNRAVRCGQSAFTDVSVKAEVPILQPKPRTEPRPSSEFQNDQTSAVTRAYPHSTNPPPSHKSAGEQVSEEWPAMESRHMVL